ncbi:MAG: rRNA maturation RNase YbeY [Bacteroidota bacterium]
MSITFSYADKRPTIRNVKSLKAFIIQIFQREATRLQELSYVFCSDEYLLAINQQFLKHDFYTDIITFDLTEALSDAISGEVYVSVDRVKDNAKALGLPFNEELLRVVFHGALHLCGYGDKKKSEIKLMRQKEDEYLRLYEEINKRST